MTQTNLREQVLWRVRSVLPEVVDWNTLLRVLRTAGQSVLQAWEHEGGWQTDPFTLYLSMAFEKYGSITRLFLSDLEIEWDADAEALPYRDYGIIEPLAVYWRPDASSDYVPVLKRQTPPSRRSAQLERGQPRTWWLYGQQMRFHPVPMAGHRLLIEAVLTPYVETATDQIVGIDPVDAPMVAQWIASFLVEWQNPQVAYAWRTEAEQVFWRRRMHHAWRTYNQRRARRFGIR